MIEYLREFVCLAETLSYTQAARLLFITQPVLSKHISKLEADLDVRLFERTKRHVELTEAGEVALDHARAVLASYDGLTGALAKFKKGAGGITVGFLLGIAGSLIPDAHSRFAVNHPDVDVSYHIYSYFDIGAALENGQVDLAIANVLGGSREMLLRSGYQSVELAREQVFAVVDKSHPLAVREGERLSAPDFEGASLLVSASEPSLLFPSASQQYFDGVNVTRIERLDNLDNIPILLSIEKSVATLPGHLRGYFEERYPGQLAYLPLSDFTPELSIAVVWRSASGDARLEDYAEAFREAFAAHAPGGAEGSRRIR